MTKEKLLEQINQSSAFQNVNIYANLNPEHNVSVLKKLNF